ncbi:MAG: hypothetical protein ABIH41_01910, partial [Nanoarchaeota archaeon]
MARDLLTHDNATGNTVKIVDAPKAVATAKDALATCTDGLLNQDEDAVDCGGTCGGFWYDGKCNSQPQQDDTVPDVECHLNSDCDDGFQCDDGQCVEIPPECVEDADCASSELCSDGECVGKTLSGEVGFKILRVDTQDVGDDAAKVTGVQVEVTNGKSQ